MNLEKYAFVVVQNTFASWPWRIIEFTKVRFPRGKIGIGKIYFGSIYG